LSPKIQIFSGVPAGFSAQKYSFKILKVLQSQIGPNEKYFKAITNELSLEIPIFLGVSAGFSNQKTYNRPSASIRIGFNGFKEKIDEKLKPNS
jgi:hypothetical protein